jgi:hypothetical protein
MPTGIKIPIDVLNEDVGSKINNAIIAASDKANNHPIIIPIKTGDSVGGLKTEIVNEISSAQAKLDQNPLTVSTEVNVENIVSEVDKLLSTLDDGLKNIKFPPDGDLIKTTELIRDIEGFKDAKIAAIGTTTEGNRVFQEFITTLSDGSGAFREFGIKADSVSGDVKVVYNGLKDVDNAAKKAGDSMSDSFAMAGAALAAAGITKLLKEIIGALTDATAASIKFESSMVELQKKTAFTTSELRGIRQEIISMSRELPFAADEIARVAANAGQIGISEGNILSFTRTMLDMGAATTLSAEQAAISFGRYRNIVQMAEEEVSNMGSAVSRLGNNFAA